MTLTPPPAEGAPTAPALPDNYMAQVVDYHRLAFAVVAEARRVATGRFGLRAAESGFTTPAFELASSASGSPAAAGTQRDSQRTVSVEGAELVATDSDGTTSRWPITTLADGGRALGLEAPGTTAREHDSPELGDIDAQLNVSRAAGEFLGWWFTLGNHALTTIAATPGAHDPEQIQLWPGHFDIATAVGEPDDGGSSGRTTRATYGFSPGDAAHSEPYIYVGPWGSVDGDDPFWQAEGFTGASMGWQQLRKADDPLEAALTFLREAYGRLNG